MEHQSATNRIEITGAGVGEISEEMIAKRARALAAADGRGEAHEGDFQESREELSGTQPETDPAEMIPEEDRAGDGVPPISGGTKICRLEPEDEGNLAAEEIEEGIAEADLDTRKKSRHTL